MSTHNIGFGGELINLKIPYSPLSIALDTKNQNTVRSLTLKWLHTSNAPSSFYIVCLYITFEENSFSLLRL